MNGTQAMTRFVSIAAALLLLLGFGASPAFAHALLRKATPGVGSTVHGSPAEVKLVFSEGVEPTFSTIAVNDAAGARFESGEPHTAPGDAKTLIVALKPLAVGVYTVEWHATSVDTHKTEGKFSFTVAP
jgi:methionine-rich copper-binding protein CopC